MFFVLQNFMPWALAAGALGFVFGLLAERGSRRTRGSERALFLVLAFVLGLGLLADALGLAPGRYGLWLEAGLTIFGGYALGHGTARAFALFLASRVREETPDWIGAARETLAQAEAFVAAAQGALAANEGALAANEAVAARLAPAAPAPAPETVLARAAPPSPEPPPTADVAAPETPNALAAIVGLDDESARELRAQGVNDLGALADLTAEGRKAAALRLGLDEAAIDFWSAQARLYAHGVASPPGGAEAETRAASIPAPAGGDDLPRSSAGRAIDSFYPGERPPGVAVAPESGADDLTRIAGIDAGAERRLHGLGIWTFAQIAAWTADQTRWVEYYLAEPGRAGRENWREQADRLVHGAPAAP